MKEIDKAFLTEMILSFTDGSIEIILEYPYNSVLDFTALSLKQLANTGADETILIIRFSDRFEDAIEFNELVNGSFEELAQIALTQNKLELANYLMTSVDLIADYWEELEELNNLQELPNRFEEG